jgi:hypothetical protein
MNLLIKYGIMAAVSGGPVLPGWAHSMKITIPASQIDAPLTNFPVTVYLTGSNFNFAQAKSDGADIVFTDINLNPLKFERQEHSNVLSMGLYHVKIPVVSDFVDTLFYMWYGNPSATDSQDKVNVWDSNHKAILHMGASLLDSTSNGNNATAIGTTVVDTALGKSRSFDGVDDYASIISQVLSSGAKTISFKFKASVKPAAIAPIINTISSSSGRNGYYAYINPAGNVNWTVYGNTQTNDYLLSMPAPGDLADNVDHYVHITTTGDTTINGTKLYVDGIQVNQGTLLRADSEITNASLPYIGRTAISSPHYFGAFNNLDDFRISNVVRPAAWVKAESLALKNQLLTFEAA